MGSKKRDDAATALDIDFYFNRLDRGTRVGSPQCIDIDSLVAPVSESSPTGTNLREDSSPASTYLRLKDARSAARLAEKRADVEGENLGVTSDWRTILEIAPKALKEQSKDLEVAAWFIEALVRSQGFAGLRDGFCLARRLVEQYWDALFSLEDEEGVATKVAPLTVLNGIDGAGTLLQPIRKIALTKAVGEGPYLVYQYEQARKSAEANKGSNGGVTLEAFMTAANASGGPYYVTLAADIQESIAELEKLSTALDERAGRDAPPTSAIQGVLTSVLEMVQSFAKDLIARATQIATRDSTDVVAAQNGGEVASGAGGVFRPNGGVRTREEALRVLLQVAEYFRQNEPHSPVATTLEELVRRARMPFSELLLELLPDRSAWRSVLTSAGIKPPPDE
jgi:type VI secretion system protein ImpA